MMHAQRYFLWLAVLLIAGCATLGQQEPGPPTGVTQTTPNLATGYQVVAMARLFAAEAVKSKILTPDDGRIVLALTDKATDILDKAVIAYINGQGDAPFRAMELVDQILAGIYDEIGDKKLKLEGGGK